MTCVLIIGFVSPCLCLRSMVGTKNTFYNVMDFGAHGNGKSDDSHVCVSALFALFSIFNLVCAS